MAYTTIDKPSEYFNTLIWSGVDGSDRAFTGVGFQPDLTWVKSRTDAYSHVIWDSVRGSGSNKELYSDLIQGEGGTGSTAANGFLSSFDSDGFSTDNGSSNTSLYFNASGKTYVGWNWLADNTSGSSNTDGSITSTVSANTTSGFSIVSYTGAGAVHTVGHGLGVIPDTYILKRKTGGTESWYFYTQKIDGSLDYLTLNTTNAKSNSSASAPTSTTFQVSSSAATGASGSTYIAYCFAEKKGFSKFGSYTGNGSADGPFIYTGFKPAFVIIKCSSTTTNWLMRDNKRDPFNESTTPLAPNLSTYEGDFSPSLNEVDILSNGFKLRDSYVDQNQSGSTYIYMAFAENPFVTSTGIPATAR